MANEAYVKPYARRADRLLTNVMLCLVGYVLLPYIYLEDGILKDPDDTKDMDAHTFWITATPRNQLTKLTIFAILGASIGWSMATIINIDTPSAHPDGNADMQWNLWSARPDTECDEIER